MSELAVCEGEAAGLTSSPSGLLAGVRFEEGGEAPKATGCEACRLAVKDVLETPDGSTPAIVVHGFILLLTLLSTLSVILETVPGMEWHRQPITIWENVVTVLFTVEILIRFWVSDSFSAYVASCSNVVDILATAPGYVEIALASSGIDPFWRVRTNHIHDPVWSLETLRVLQLVRLVRILRMVKAARHSEIVTTVMLSFYSSLTGLSALIVFVGSSSVLSATVVFYTDVAEPETQFVSIPAALWWSIATITGVGYGDMVPTTVAGKSAGSVTMIMGVLSMAMSVAIITTAFMEEYRKSVALAKLNRTQKRRKTSGLSPHDEPARAESSRLSLLSQRRISGFSQGEMDEASLLPTLIDLQEKSTEVLMQLEATALKVEGLGSSTAVSRRRTSLPVLSPRSTSSSGSSKAMAGTKAALAFLREQNAVWYRSATQLAEQILESQAEAEGVEEDLT